MELRLHHRIVLPIALVAVGGTLGVSLVALSVTSSTVSRHVNRSITDTARVVSRGGFASNEIVLSTVKQVSGADVVTFDEQGVVATTLEADVRDAVIARVVAGRKGLNLNGDVPVGVQLPGAPSFFAAYILVNDLPNTVVVLLHDNVEVDAANRVLTRTIFVGASVSLVVMLLASQLVARRVTQPMSRLVDFAGAVGTPGLEARADTGTDEVGRLGAAFNDMLDRLDQVQAAAVRSEKLVLAGMFAARVAHDVRNPLSSLKLQTQLIQTRTSPGTDEHRMTSAMLEDIAQVEFVVANLLDLARPPSLERKPQNLNPLLQDVVRQVTPQCHHRHIKIALDLGAAIPPVNLDAARFTQAVLNLVVNAVEALRERGTLTVRSRLSPDSASVVIEVDDDGVGLDPQASVRLFDPFVSTKPDGVGLGLVNARAAVESHGGTLVLQPRQPVGTRATVTLPVTVSSEHEHG